MGILGRVLQGIGSALVEQGKIDAQAARDDLLMRREMALKQLEFQHDDAVRPQTQHQDKAGRASYCRARKPAAPTYSKASSPSAAHQAKAMRATSPTISR
jgi:hypothetical protein